MKKTALLLALAAFVAAPAAIAAAPAKKSGQLTFDQAMALNRRNLHVLVEGIPLILPGWAQMIYFKMHKDADASPRGRHTKH